MGIFPPPIIELAVIEWCGFLKGLFIIIPESFFNSPATLYILVISNASLKLKSGNIVGSLFAIIVLPEPGPPINIQL